jgi:transposase
MLPATTRLAKTIQAWWPAILAALTNDVSTPVPKDSTRDQTNTKRVGCGYRSTNNYQRRILSHIAVTRPQKISSMNGTTAA